MGLSPSQGRLLMLTARLSDIELQEIMISQRQNQLAWKSEEAAQEYSEAMNNYKVTIRMPDDEGEGGYKKQDLTYENMTQMGYIATSANEEIYLKKDEKGDWIIPKDSSGKEIISIDKTTGKAKLGNKEFSVLDGSKFFEKPEVLQQAIINGVLYLSGLNKESGEAETKGIAADTGLEYVLDTSDDAQAESKYEYDTTRISRQDNQLEMDLKQLETQHEAIAKEIDSVKDVIKNNVERTFNLFSNG